VIKSSFSDVYCIVCITFTGVTVHYVVLYSKVNNMEIVEDSGFDSDQKTSASVPMAEESELNKIHEVCCVSFLQLCNFTDLHIRSSFVICKTGSYMHCFVGTQTLQTRGTSEPRHFGNIDMGPKCPDSPALVRKCPCDTSAPVPNCLQLVHF